MHNFTTFCDSNENILWSLRWDCMALINRWQNAADNGYGLCACWGQWTDLALDGVEWFSQRILRNLVAIAAFTTMMVVYGAVALWQWWQAQGIDYALTITEGGVVAAHGAICVATLAAFLVAGLACGGVSCLVVAGCFVRKRVWPVVVGALDKGCQFIFCLN